MSKRAEVLKRLYDSGRVTVDGLRKAVTDGVITEAEFSEIIGEG